MNRQRGIALITAVLVVALAAIAATAILSSANIAIRRTANLQDSEKAWWYASGVESWAKSLLDRDRDENQIDALGDLWARPVDYLPTDEGFLRGAIIDHQGCFNLNNLGTTQPDAYRQQAEIFVRLASLLEAGDASYARTLAARIHDWVDADNEPAVLDNAYGAEDSEYLSISPSYRVANRPMTSVSELLAVKDVTPEVFQKLRPAICVLPQTGTTINVNTAVEPLMRALATQPSPGLEAFLRSRGEQPVKTPQELFEPARNVYGANDARVELMTAKSQFFQLRAEAFVGSGRVALYSSLYRPDQGLPAVYGRSIQTD
ncbi:MAG TPA: type II secretion system minor pseudopilin GspK [Solimonas sp.]|nr:type II secretion system minor pseudopilin GspK [Solimonas sp.]